MSQRFDVVYLLVILLASTGMAAVCNSQSQGSGYHGCSLASAPLARGICPDGQLVCNASTTSAIAKSSVDSELTYCGPADSKVYCRNFGHVSSYIHQGGRTCIKCRGSFSALRILVSTCRWKNAMACKEDEILAGVCPSCNDAMRVRCCIVQHPGCAISPQWRFPTATEASCPIATGIVAACAVQCSSCLKLAVPNGGMFCQGALHYNENTVQPPFCGKMPHCPPQSVVIGYTPCTTGDKETSITCATLRAGEIDVERCETVSSNGQAWCPQGYIAVAICAPPFPNTCGGKHTSIKCCYIKAKWNTNPCTALAGFFPIAGNADIDASCTNFGFETEGLLGTSLTNVSRVISNTDLNIVYAISNYGENLLALPAVQFRENRVHLQPVTLKDASDMERISARTLLVSERRGATIRLLNLLPSGLAWLNDIRIGAAVGAAETILNRSFITSPITPVRGVAYDPFKNEIYFTSLSFIYVATEGKLIAFVGGEKPLMDNVFRTETSLVAPYHLVLLEEEIFWTDPGTHSVRYVNKRNGLVLRLIGVHPGEDSNIGVDSCAAGRLLNQTHLGSPAGLVFYERSRSLYVADTEGRCIRRFPLASVPYATCYDVLPFVCGSLDLASEVQRSAHFVGDIFLPVSISVSDTHLFVVCRDTAAVYAMLLHEVIASEITETRSPVLSLTESLSLGVSDTITVSETDTRLITPSITYSSSETTCADLQPQGRFLDANGKSISYLRGDQIQALGVKMYIELLTCHRWQTWNGSFQNATLPIPSLPYNPEFHPNEDGVSIFGFNRVQGNLPGFMKMHYSNATQRAMLEMVPWKKYHPALEERIDVTWTADSFEYSHHPLVITLTVFPNKQKVYKPEFVGIMDSITTILLTTCFLAGSSAPPLRVFRLDFMVRASSCPTEDTSDALPFSVHPFQIPIGSATFRYLLGAILLNCSFILFLAGIHLLAASLCYAAIRSERTRPFSHALAFVRFPSLLIAPIMLILQPTMMAALKMAWNGAGPLSSGERGERVAASTALLGIISFSSFVYYILAPANFAAEPKTDTTHEKWTIYFVGQFRYKADGSAADQYYCQRYGSMFREYKPTRVWFFMIEYSFALVMAFDASLSLSSNMRCTLGQTSVGVLFIVYVVVLKLYDPIQSSVSSKLMLASAVLDVLSIGAAAISWGTVMDYVAMVAMGGSCACIWAICVFNIVIFVTIESKALRAWWRERYGERGDAQESTGGVAFDLQKLGKVGGPSVNQDDHLRNPLLEMPLLPDPKEYERPNRVPITPRPSPKKLSYLKDESDEEREMMAKKKEEQRALEQQLVEQRQREIKRQLTNDEEIMMLI